MEEVQLSHWISLVGRCCISCYLRLKLLKFESTLNDWHCYILLKISYYDISHLSNVKKDPQLQDLKRTLLRTKVFELSMSYELCTCVPFGFGGRQQSGSPQLTVRPGV